MQDLMNALSMYKKLNIQEKLVKWITLVCTILSLYIETSVSTSKSYYSGVGTVAAMALASF